MVDFNLASPELVECLLGVGACSSLYIQKADLSAKTTKRCSCSCISFRPLQAVSLDSIKQGSHHIQRMNTLFQLAKLEQFLYQNQLTYHGQQVILAVFPSVLSGIEKELLIFAHRLTIMKIELVIDVVHMDSSLLGTVCRLAEQGIIFSIGRVEWQQLWIFCLTEFRISPVNQSFFW
jgi:hypothetical protein